MNDENRGFRVFYRDYVNGVSISSATPEWLAADRVGPLAESLLQHADNFLGVVDGNDLIVQAYLDDDEKTVFLELLYPENPGAMRLDLPWADAIDILSDLPEEFSEELLPGARYVG